jgi:signal transduction histidine kinase
MTEPASVQERLAELRRGIDDLLSRDLPRPEAEGLRQLQARLELLAATLQGTDESERLAALYQVSRALGSSLQLEQVLNQVMAAVIQLTGAERGFLMLLDEATGALHLQAARNFEGKTLDQDDMQVSRTLIQTVLQTGEGVVTTNAQSDARFSNQESVVMYALRSILCVPLRARGQITGAIYVDNKIKTGLFDQGDLELLEAFASQAAAAIENARLYTQTDAALAERVAELETLQRIDRQLNTGLDLARVLDLTLDWALRGTQAEAGWIAMRQDDSSPVIVVAGEGKGALLNPESSDLAPAFRDGVPVSRKGGTDRLPPRLIVPILRETRTLALIGVRRTGQPFTPDAEAFLIRLADHAAMALENTRLYQAVQQANLAKSQFVSTVSHELKNPMTSIRGYADLMRQGVVGPISDQGREFLGTIVDNVDQMAALVSDLSDISRIETGRLRLDLSPVDLGHSVQETAITMKPLIDGRRQVLTIDIPEVLPPVLADRTRLVQVITNLISNACKYTPDGGRITLSARAEDRSVRTSVADTGIGMSTEDQGQLFTQFFRSEDSAVRDQPGWGLGLSVTRRLVELQGGDMGFSSILGQGSTFWFRLPVAEKT